jgi:lipid-A-disaccharide synthase
MAETLSRKYYLIAGERSGDLHGSNLIKALKKLGPDAKFRGWGGDMMEDAGMELVTHYNRMAFMGIWEVIQNLGTIRKLLRYCKKDLVENQPDVLILIDYPGFNLRMAKFAHDQGVRVFYYISPKVWAWNTKRAHKIRKYVDRLFSILPFEKDFFRKYNVKVDYVGNPLMDAKYNFIPNPDFRDIHGLSEKPILAILPGSRKQEISNMLDEMIRIAPDYPDYQFVVAAIRNLDPSFYQKALDDPLINLVYDETYDLLNVSQAAMVASGTATLETALFNVPQVVCYRMNPISFAIGKLLVKVKYISLVNLIAGKEVVRELIQGEFNTQRLKEELDLIIEESPERQRMLDEYGKIGELLKKDSPSEKAASLMIQYLND